MASFFGKRYWHLSSFFLIPLTLPPVILGISLSFYSIQFGIGSEVEIDQVKDSICLAFAILGILLTWISEAQMKSYKLKNERKKAYGIDIIPVLNQGLWRLSRHPNYFGNLLFWAAISYCNVTCLQPYFTIGIIPYIVA